jgi:DNA polymerase I-like protein with 3'-5' exonuclease and polymerase domains
MDDFFQVINSDEPIKCQGCKLNTKEYKKKVQSKKHYSIQINSENSDVLFITESNLSPALKLVFDKKLKNLFTYDVISGIDCSLKKEFDYPSPVHPIFESCNNLHHIDISKYKVVICEGRSVYALTRSSDIKYFHDFTEIVFNQTYFLYNTQKNNKLIRVYPIPHRNDFLNEHDTGFRAVWEKNYFDFQLSKIKDYLSEYKDTYLKPYELIYLNDPNEFLQENLSYDGYLAWDIEVASNNKIISLQMFDDFKVTCITMSFDGVKGYYLPFDKIDKSLLKQFFSNKKGILANGKYDTKCLHNAGIENLQIADDVILMNKVLNTERMSNSIKALAWLIGMGGYDYNLDSYVSKYKISNYGDIPEKLIFPYATIDAIVTYRLWEYAIEKSKLQPEPFNAYREYIIPALEVFKSAELEGLTIDIDYLNKFNSELLKEIEEVSEKIYAYIGKRFVINSLDELGDALKEKGLPPIELNKKNKYKTGENEILQWKKLGFVEIADLLSKYRELSTLRTTFVGNSGKKEIINNNVSNDFFQSSNTVVEENESIVDGIVKFICKDNKVHPSFGVAMTDSGRASCNNPNFQNQPKQGGYAKRFRKIYYCPKDWYYGGFDYSGFQLRIAAIYSQDENMLDAFINRGGDLHSATAQIVFARNMTLDEFIANKGKQPYKKWRFEAKAVNFSFLFSGHFSLMYDNIDAWGEKEVTEYIQNNKLEILDIKNKTKHQLKVLTVCKDIQDQFFKLYPRLKEWFNNSHNFAIAKGYIDSPLGGRRHLPRLLFNATEDNKLRQKNLLNISLNSPVQNFEALTVYKAMTNIYNDLKKYNLKSKLVGSVHDEITHLIYKPEVKTVYEIAKKHMTIPTEIWGCPITAELGIGYIWGFDTEATEKNIDKFEKGNFIKVYYIDDKGKRQEYENIAYDVDDMTQEFNKKFFGIDIKKIEIIH